MIEVTDEMVILIEEYIETFQEHLYHNAEELVRKTIELHEQSKPKPEPVGYGLVIKGVLHATKDEAGSVGFVPLYTTPPT